MGLMVGAMRIGARVIEVRVKGKSFEGENGK